MTASDIATRIKARFSKRRNSATPSLESSQSKLGEASASSVPSLSSREASFASHAQLTASQTSDEQTEHAETGSHGTAGKGDDGDADATKWLHVNKRRYRATLDVQNEGQNENVEDLESSTPQAHATSPRVMARATTRNVMGTPDHGATGRAPGETVLDASEAPGAPGAPGAPEAPAETISSQQQSQSPGHPRALQVSNPRPPDAPDPPVGGAGKGLACDKASDKASDKVADKGRIDAPHTVPVQSRLGPGQMEPVSGLHLPAQLNTAVHLPPPSRSTPSPTSSPVRASINPALLSVDRSPAKRWSGRTPNFRLSDIGSKVPSTHAEAADDLDVDPLQPPHHGREPDQLSFASSSAVASASASASAATASSAASSAQSPASFATAEASPRRQSLFASRQTSLIKTLLRSNQPQGAADFEHRHSIDTNMVTRKIWVRRPHASATTITINEEDLVDDVRDMILRKYANSLGRTFDSPDLVIRVQPRDKEKERILGPEEIMARTLDTYFPGGQSVDEALTIDIPRRTPKASPRASAPIPGVTPYYISEDARPSEAGEGYFPPVVALPSPHGSHPVPATAPNGTMPHSIAVLGTGHIPPIPSPGGTISRSRLYRERPDRPRLNRTHTSSPTLLPGHTSGPQASGTANHDHPSGLPAVKTPMAKSPGPEPTPARVVTPPPRSSSPRPSTVRPRRSKKPSEYSAPANVLNGSVPPINVLIVEDNPINLKLLEAFVKRLKVRWQTAMNGRDAVKKWRTGGFHLVLMDIQLPVMNGLDATREIRRLERVNSIGVFTSAPDGTTGNGSEDIKEENDRLPNLTLFKSPVIIVALTASSLQSDRHEALAAGCNDFLTKPVNFVWLERKVMEWGCMQALIDFDGWRKWKEAFSQQNEEREAVKKAQANNKAKPKKGRSSLSAA